MKRRLEIGADPFAPIAGFETLNIRTDLNVDYVVDAAGPLPFADGTFEIVYASHVLEHISWRHHWEVLKEWTRIIEPGGSLEIWIPDGLKMARAFIAAECEVNKTYLADARRWRRFANSRDMDVTAWYSARTCVDGAHQSILTERRLRALMESAGLTVQRMDLSEVRGYNHGWINLGMRGRK